MIFKWIQSVRGKGEAAAIEQAGDAERRRRRDAKLVDVAHEAMVRRQDQQKLEGLIKRGWPHVQREEFKGKVRQKVWDTVRGSYGVSDDDEMVEEITERVVDAAEADPFYKRLFD